MALLRLRREAKDYGVRMGGGTTLLLPPRQFRLEALRETEATADKADLEALVGSVEEVFGKTIELGNGEVAFVKARQILEQWRFLERDDDVLVTVGEAKGDGKCLTITVKGALGWKTGGYAVAYHTQSQGAEEDDEEDVESVELGLTTLSHCGWTGVLELKAVKDQEGLVSFSASVLRSRGRAPRLAKDLVQRTLEAVELEHARLMQSYSANENLRERYLAAKESEKQKAAMRQREKMLHPEKYRPLRPGRDAAIEGGRWTPSSELQARRNPTQFVSSSSSTCVSGS